MNCQQFETIITGLARKKAIVEAAARESGLAHTKACPRCASRLADEQSLSDGLRAVALASKGTEEAPPRIEAALRAAFREGRARPASPAGIASPIAATSSRRRWLSQRSARPATAAAAMILLVIGLLVATRLLRTPWAGPVEQSRGIASLAVMPEGTPAPDQAPVPRNIDTASDSPINYEPQELMIHPPLLRAPLRMSRTGESRRSDSDATRVAVNASPREIEDAPELVSEGEIGEIATDFLPFMPAGDLSSLEGGQVVRVELPRSALVSFGLSTNMERSGERVKADVLLGEDGMARAIRFVR